MHVIVHVRAQSNRCVLVSLCVLVLYIFKYLCVILCVRVSCIYVRIRRYKLMGLYVNTCACIYICVYAFTYLHVCTCICILAFAYNRYVCLHLFINICMYLYMLICMWMHNKCV